MLRSTIFLVFVTVAVTEKSFYLGPKYPHSACYKNEACIEVKVTKPLSWTSGEHEGQIYEGDTIEVTCVPPKWKISPITLFVQPSHEVITLNSTNSTVFGNTPTQYSVKATKPVTNANYHCGFGLVTTEKHQWLSQPFSVQIVQKPYLKYIRHDNQTLQNGRNGSLECEIDGYPTPTYYWFKDGHEKMLGNASNSRILSIDNVNWDDGGTYFCTAVNRAGFESQSIRVGIVQNRKSTEIGKENIIFSRWTIGIVLFLIFLNVSCLCWCYNLYKSRSSHSLREAIL